MIVGLDATPLTIPTGGVARYTRELARALALRYPGDRFCLLSDQPFPMPPNAGPNLTHGDLPRGVARKWWLWGLQQEMMRRRIDVFHGTDFAVPYLPLRPAVMTLHDLAPWLDRDARYSSRVRRRTPILLRAGLATMVITPTEAIRAAVIDRFGLAADRVVAVPLAASEHFRPVLFQEEKPPYFLFTGTLEPRKNLARLLDAWRDVRNTHPIDLVVAGRARPDFPPIPAERGLRVLGAVPDSDLPALYSNALAVVYPSLYEGFGLPVLEAMQCGALVVTSKDPAILEVAADAAIHVEATDAQALAQALNAIAADPEKFAVISSRALDRARCFSWRKTAERTREVYDAAVRVFRK